MIKIHNDVVQGSDEWHAMRCGIITASSMKHLLTPALKWAANEKQKAHFYEILAQRITKFVEPSYISDDMLRGQEDEIEARLLYAKTYGPVTEVGFITNDNLGFVIGYSPDGLVGDDGLIECKSRSMKHQMRTIIDHALEDKIDPDYMLQVQTGLLVSERKWCDLVSYCGGLPMVTVRVFPDPVIQAAIVEVSQVFEEDMAIAITKYETLIAGGRRAIPTVRKIEEQMI